MVQVAMVSVAHWRGIWVSLSADCRADCVFLQWGKRGRIPASRMDVPLVSDTDGR